LEASEAAWAKIEGHAATHRSVGSMTTAKRTPTFCGYLTENVWEYRTTLEEEEEPVKEESRSWWQRLFWQRVE
jgi:hypothetical protein